uniref:Uncharacterized protein n=1 Tax=Anguilla anguilla TaxID=7936 RepID=A0A0E9V4X7_ANGAN
MPSCLCPRQTWLNSAHRPGLLTLRGNLTPVCIPLFLRDCVVAWSRFSWGGLILCI